MTTTIQSNILAMTIADFEAMSIQFFTQRGINKDAIKFEPTDDGIAIHLEGLYYGDSGQITDQYDEEYEDDSDEFDGDEDESDEEHD